MSIHDYKRAYDEDHDDPMIRNLHLVGLPLVFLSPPFMLIVPPLGLCAFVIGSVLTVASHLLAGKKPSHRWNLRYFFVGPVWWTLEVAKIIRAARRRFDENRFETGRFQTG
jgi:hypothetical protein